MDRAALTIALLSLAACNLDSAFDRATEYSAGWSPTESTSTSTTADSDSGVFSVTGDLSTGNSSTSASATTESATTDSTSEASTTADGSEEGTSGPVDTTSGPTPFCGDGAVNTPFEECDVGTPDPDGPCSPTCRRARIIFVLSLYLNGKLSGLQGADAYCRSQAQKAKLADPSSPIVDPANFKALLPSSTETVFERHFRGEGPYRLVNGLTVSDSFAQLFSEPLQNPINVDEFSQTRNTVVVTGLTEDGASYPGIDFCNDWTGTKGSASEGHSEYTSTWWVELPVGQPTTDCAHNWALYCVEQQ